MQRKYCPEEIASNFCHVIKTKYTAVATVKQIISLAPEFQWSTQKTSTHDSHCLHNKFKCLPLEVNPLTIWPQQTFLTIPHAMPIKDPAGLKHFCPPISGPNPALSSIQYYSPFNPNVQILGILGVPLPWQATQTFPTPAPHARHTGSLPVPLMATEVLAKNIKEDGAPCGESLPESSEGSVLSDDCAVLERTLEMGK